MGETHKHGVYRRQVRAGLRWLKERQDDQGRFGEGEDHAIATLAMTEVYSLTASPWFKESAQRAARLVLGDSSGLPLATAALWRTLGLLS